MRRGGSHAGWASTIAGIGVRSRRRLLDRERRPQVCRSLTWADRESRLYHSTELGDQESKFPARISFWSASWLQLCAWGTDSWYLSNAALSWLRSWRSGVRLRLSNPSHLDISSGYLFTTLPVFPVLFTILGRPEFLLCTLALESSAQTTPQQYKSRHPNYHHPTTLHFHHRTWLPTTFSHRWALPTNLTAISVLSTALRQQSLLSPSRAR